MSQRMRMTVIIEVDGVSVPGFPITREMSVEESQGFTYEEADDGNSTTFSTLPTQQLATVQVLAVTPDQATTYRFDGQSNAGITLAAGGMIAIFNATIDAGAGSSNTSVNNNSGSTAKILGIAGGT